jgi:hypothetical protein
LCNDNPPPQKKASTAAVRVEVSSANTKVRPLVETVGGAALVCAGLGLICANHAKLGATVGVAGCLTLLGSALDDALTPTTYSNTWVN